MKYALLLILLFLSLGLMAQVSSRDFRVMWYNVENLFDTVDDPEKNDDEFLPSGDRYWTRKRYYHKLRQVARVITAAGQWDTPALVGLCEVENDSVLTHLITHTPLRSQHYRYCITKGSDLRGINVALLYQRDKFALIGEESIPVRLTEGKGKTTRDILHVWGEVVTGDTLDIFACHFPSRSGGEKETENNRRDACRLLRSLCDSVSAVRQSSHILIMGDLNDTPDTKNIREVLGAVPLNTSDHTASLVNLFGDPEQLAFPGSHKYQGEWHQLDHIIVGRNLLEPSNALQVAPANIALFTPSFLLKKDKTWRGKRPKRTYYGFRYEAGYSDHLPLVVTLTIGNSETD
ncbi:endonuclease [Parabacteroides sp. PF5-6]|uniref:endonuclease/exonuclease/phosphatase family protein n=1 Tax=Parabacteroides sp. PF5-6 TaxID=1742403 RepID=UPI002406EB76|nr:endonuclease [Parabacteroides sp. PF5-6]MDF9829180.1 endonuclease/exonuclease/phosphatase family metal-dependent hydrolase [Parabacteroides sp. PF5-6]